MKKAFVSILLLTVLLFSGCDPVLQDNTDTNAAALTASTIAPTNTAPTDPSIPITLLPTTKYIVYSNFIRYDSGNDDVTYVNRYDLPIEFSAFLGTKYINDSAAPSTSVTLCGVAYELDYYASFEDILADCPDETLRKLSRYDEYRGQYNGKEIEVHLQPGTGHLIHFRRDANIYEGTMTEDQAIASAKALFAELYGEQTLQQYSDVIVLGSLSKDYSHDILFNRNLHGFSTDDSVTIVFYLDGTLKYIHAHKFGYFNSIAQEVTAEMIADAQNALLSTTQPQWEVLDQRLELGSDGKCYLRIDFDFHQDSPGYDDYNYSLNINVN